MSVADLHDRYPYASYLKSRLPMQTQIDMALWLDNNVPAWESMQNPYSMRYEVFFDSVRHKQMFEIAWSEWVEPKGQDDA